MTPAERRAESDHEVAVNLPAELLPVWHRVRRFIRATDYMSRTEAFAQWCHDHGADVARYQAEAVESGLRAILRDETPESVYEPADSPFAIAFHEAWLESPSQGEASSPKARGATSWIDCSSVPF